MRRHYSQMMCRRTVKPWILHPKPYPRVVSIQILRVVHSPWHLGRCSPKRRLCRSLLSHSFDWNLQRIVFTPKPSASNNSRTHSSSSLCENQLKSSSVSDQTWSTPGLDLLPLPWSLSTFATEMSHDRQRGWWVLGVKHWIVLETMSELNPGTWANKGIH